MDLLTLLSEAPLAKASARLDTARDSATPDLALHSAMCRLLSRFSRDGSSGRTSQAYCPQTTGRISDASSPRLMTSGLVWHGRFWTASGLEWRRGGAACSLSDILEAVEDQKPDVLIIDSIQTVYNEENESTPGSVSQVKDCTMSLMHLSKSMGIMVFVVGHINKDGNIAGPKVLEHMVDCVLYFEGDANSSYRLLRAAKNRFGSTNEIGVFEMADTGLIEVPNPSQMLLEGRPEGASGTCVACVMEGTRPILAEVQALVSKTSFNVPRRTADGFDFNRAALLLAVAEKRGGMKLSLFDAYINVIGGLRLDEPGADLPVVLAVASSYRDQTIDDDLVAIGEVGLTGEIRSVSNMNQRLAEVSRLGFKKCIIPRNGADKLEIPKGLTVYKVRNIREAIEAAM